MKKFILMVVFSLLANFSIAATIYDESIHGDAAGSIGTATALGTLSVGSSTVIGDTVTDRDNDWFKFSVSSGTTLDSIVLTSLTGPVTGGNLGWSNDGITPDTDFAGPFDSSLIGLDLLENGPISLVASAFLGAGTYAIKFGSGTNDNFYSVDFNVSRLSPVPLPAAAWLFITALVGLVGIRRKQLKSA